MKVKAHINKIYKPSENVVAREIQGEFIMIPIASGVDDREDEIFVLNETGRAVWERLNGERTLKDVGVELAQEYEISHEEIEQGISGIVGELLKRKILVEVR